MCGIAGIVSSDPSVSVSERQIARMCRTIVHRGPDDEGSFVSGPVGLGIRRLSIIDVSGGHQPVHNEDRTVWVVFNGEIYNFQSLRRELEQGGHQFYSNTDTEVLVHLYEEYGSELVNKLRGMFAFALFDSVNRKLILARDRLGKKPLHYALMKDKILFGSEIKAVLAGARELKAEIDHAGLLGFFYFGYIPEPHTAFRGIKKLPPAHILEYESGRVRLRQYWDLPEFETCANYSEEQCLDDLASRLTEAVRLRLISDVPVGALLSGGVDSSTVVACMSRVSPDPVETFSISFDDESFNESKYAAAVAKQFGTNHHELRVDPDITNTLLRLSSMLEEPFGDSSVIPTYHVARLAREYVKVALSGDGGDELFAGYGRYPIHLSRAWLEKVPARLRSLYLDAIYPRLPDGIRSKKLAHNLALSSAERYIDGLSFFPLYQRQWRLLSTDFLNTCGDIGRPSSQMRKFFDDAPASDLLSRMLYVDTKMYLCGDILAKVDRMSMANSLEVRAPLLDHVLVEWVTSLPGSWKLRNGVRKYLLKRLAEKLGVPRHVIYRRKQGFALPLAQWLRTVLKEDVGSVLLESRTLCRGFFEPKAIQTLFEQHCRGRADFSSILWLLLVFELWHRNFLETNEPGEAIRMCAS